MASKVNGISISGDGVAIGAGNTVVVHKHRVINNNHSHNNGGGKDSDEGHNLLAFSVTGIVILLTAAYFFAKYADQFFAVAFITGWVVTGLPLLSLGTQLFLRQPVAHPWQESGTFALSGIMTWFIHDAWQKYPEEFGKIASHSNSPHVLWCALNPYGESILSEYLIAAFGLTITVYCLLPHSLRSFFQFFLEPDNLFQEWLGEASSKSKLVGATLMMGLVWAMFGFAGPQVQSFMDGLRPLICHGG